MNVSVMEMIVYNPNSHFPAIRLWEAVAHIEVQEAGSGLELYPFKGTSEYEYVPICSAVIEWEQIVTW